MMVETVIWSFRIPKQQQHSGADGYAQPIGRDRVAHCLAPGMNILKADAAGEKQQQRQVENAKQQQPPRIDVKTEEPHFHGHQHGQGKQEGTRRAACQTGQKLSDLIVTGVFSIDRCRHAAPHMGE